MSLIRYPAAALAAIISLAPAIRSQCTPAWLPGDPIVVPFGSATRSVLWDPDGAGPQSPVLVLGGLLSAGHHSYCPVVTWSGSAWAPLGNNLTGSATALGVHNGELYAATAGSGTYKVWRWTGATWSQVGYAAGIVEALTSFGGQLVAAGNFPTIDGVAANKIASWDGTTWSALGSGLVGDARCLAGLGGVLYVGGEFVSAGGVPAGNLAMWNGSSWSAGPAFDDVVEAIAVRSTTAIVNSYVFVAGRFSSYTLPGATTPTPAAWCARFAPATGLWTNFSNPNGPIVALNVRSTAHSTYEIAALSESPPSFRVATSTGSTWTTLSPSLATQTTAPGTLNWYQGRYTVGVNALRNAVQLFDGTEWSGAKGAGIDGVPLTVAAIGNDLVIGGVFDTISGVTVNNLARGSAGNWAPIGGGLTGTWGIFVWALAEAANGDLIVGGAFDHAGTTPAMNIARWDGTTWHAYGSGLPGQVHALLPLPNGELIAGGTFTVAGGGSNIVRWDGAAWHPLGSGCSGVVSDLALLPNGDIVAVGGFSYAGGNLVNHIARWDGSAWHGLGSGSDGIISAVELAPNGDLYVGGAFTTIGGLTTRLAKWSAGAWSPVTSLGLNDSFISAMALHADGSLLVGGEMFSFPGPFGTGWSSSCVRIQNGVVTPMAIGFDVVYEIAVEDDIVVVGDISFAGTLVSSRVARFHTPCPATAVAYGATCPGLTGPLSLQARIAPWIGGTFKLEASTFGPLSLGVLAFGGVPISVPLGSIFGDAGPGCLAAVVPDQLLLLLPSNGTATFAASVPLAPSLVGATLFAQALQLEPGPQSRTSTSNGIELTVGQL